MLYQRKRVQILSEWFILWCIFIIVCIVVLIEGYLFGDRDGQGQLHTSVIIFKLPRSGSSWFTELLNEQPDIFISKEIIQGNDALRYTTAIKEAHLSRAISTPTGKLSFSQRYIPDGRFVEDYTLHRSFKLFRSMGVIGFTVNPEHCKDVDWQKVIHGRKNVKIVIFSRKNTVKAAISAIRGNLTKKYCGTANLRASTSTSTTTSLFSTKNCSLPTSADRVNISLKQLNQLLAFWQTRHDHFQKITTEILKKLQLQSPYLVVNYEELQTDHEETIQRLLAFLLPTGSGGGEGEGERGRGERGRGEGRAPADGTKEGVERISPPKNVTTANKITDNKPRGGKGKGKGKEKGQGIWTKRTSDDLSTVLTQFSTILQNWQHFKECNYWTKQLIDGTTHEDASLLSSPPSPSSSSSSYFVNDSYVSYAENRNFSICLEAQEILYRKMSLLPIK